MAEPGRGVGNAALEAIELGLDLGWAIGGMVGVPIGECLSLGSPFEMCLSNMCLASVAPGSWSMSIQAMGFALQSNKAPMSCRCLAMAVCNHIPKV
jgi:hypothetical protein